MPRDLQPCGTVAAARRHQRAHEPLDDACAQAVRDEKNARKEAGRVAAAAIGREAMPEPDAPVDRDAVLHEVLRTLRGQLAEAPPQSVASIAKQIRDTLDALGASSDSLPVRTNGLNDIARAYHEKASRIG